MNWDLATFLVLAIAICLVIWLVDRALFYPKRKRLSHVNAAMNNNELQVLDDYREPLIVDLARSFLPVLIFVLVMRSFVVEPFKIPSGSMMPTLLIGDFILVNKFSYGIRLPVLNTKVIEIDKPKRGDVVVFRYPQDPKVPYIKRVIGLPGDHVAYHDRNKTVYINGEPIPQEYLGLYQGVGQGSNMTGAEQRLELLPDAHHHVLVMPNQLNSFKFKELVVPDNEYFVLGDNRDNSHDSRVWGTVPEANLVGKAFLIWMNWDMSNGGISWQRLGDQIQ